MAVRWRSLKSCKAAKAKSRVSARWALFGNGFWYVTKVQKSFSWKDTGEWETNWQNLKCRREVKKRTRVCRRTDEPPSRQSRGMSGSFGCELLNVITDLYVWILKKSMNWVNRIVSFYEKLSPQVLQGTRKTSVTYEEANVERWKRKGRHIKRTMFSFTSFSTFLSCVLVACE